jgi:Mrp family chromosome partitioning ATPase
VVRAFKTSKDLVRRASRALRDVGGRTVGIVLNAVDLQRREHGYYQYYYYKQEGYGANGSGDTEQELSAKSPAAPPPPPA